MNKADKILLFEYIVYHLIEWYKKVVSSNKNINKHFSRLTALKLLFFVSTIKDTERGNEDLLDIFNKFCAMQYGPVEIDIYTAIVEDKTQLYKFGVHETFKQMAYLMNYYCTHDGHIQQVSNLLSQFEEKYKNLYENHREHNFDKYALCTLRNFMYNCQLSYLLKKDEYTIEDLCDKIEQIENIQEETCIRNFYPYKKAIEFLINKTKSKIEERNTSFDYNSTIKLLDSYLSIFDKNIDWCKSHRFYPVQLLLKECIVFVNEDKLFLPSSISRPIDYDKLEKLRENFRVEIEYIRNSVIYIKDKVDTESIKDELKNIEKRYIEIGGVLISIVTFLFGTINIFSQQIATPRNLLESTMFLGVILVLFALLLVIVLEFWKRKVNKTKFTICGIVFVVYTVIICALLF